MNTSMHKTRRLTAMAVMAALSVALVAMIHFPVFPAVAFLEYDPADIAILICGFAFGPLAGICVTAVAALIQGLTVSVTSGVYGIIMHLIATGTYVTVASLIYQKHKTKKSAALSLLFGTLAMAAIMVPSNLLITPYFMGAPVAAIVALLPYIVLFNLIKAGANGIITFFVYKSISKLLYKLDVKDTDRKAPVASREKPASDGKAPDKAAKNKTT
ncbi:MAG TPA: ECF transporter S component [Oscillospiraceae bacterium]|nr:ECF transporter S component [Oscillospiraceae bacterium]HPS76247.1 ECF transporter S component [Oscillospiraceae bacterium]